MGHVVRETDDEIMIFAGGDGRYDIPKSEIMFVSGNVLIDLPMYEIAKRYKVSREESLPAGKAEKDPWTKLGNVDLASYKREYPKSLFNKDVRSNNEDHGGHLVKETDDKIVVLGH